MENIILKNLIENELYSSKVLPHISSDFFESNSKKIIFKIIKSYILKYNKTPTYTAIGRAVQKNIKISESTFKEIMLEMEDIKNNYDEQHELEWLIDETEEYCKNKAIEQAIFQAVTIYEDEKQSNTKIEELIRNALKVSFRQELGITFFNEQDIEKRYDYMTSPRRKFASHLRDFNILCGGGIEPKTLSVLVGDTHSGKCVCGDTEITIRNKHTGLIEKINIETFHKMLSQNSK